MNNASILRINRSLLAEMAPAESALITDSDLLHIAKGGTFDITEGALKTEFWDALSKAAVVATLVQFSIWAVEQTQFDGEATCTLVLEENSVEGLRGKVKAALMERYDLTISESDEFLSDEVFQRVISDVILEMYRK